MEINWTQERRKTTAAYLIPQDPYLPMTKQQPPSSPSVPQFDMSSIMQLKILWKNFLEFKNSFREAKNILTAPFPVTADPSL
jgi:hypothetical protein